MLQRFFAALLAMLMALTPSAAVPEGAESGVVYRALLVGCDRFITQPDTTPSSANNVMQMASALESGTLPLAQITASPDGVTSAGDLATLVLETFEEADGDDVSIFYISTHGLWEPGVDSGSMELLLSDGVQEGRVTARQLRDLFDQIGGSKILYLDACHAGAMLGKGVDAELRNVFAAPEYTVICSSGGAEESWFWSGDVDGERLAGAGYFSGALTRALSVSGGYGADDNRDGVITLTELKRCLMDTHGASTVQTYPESADTVLMTYDPEWYALNRRAARIEGVCFETDVLSPIDNTAHFTFNVVSSVQVAYQLVYHRQGRWDFDNAQLIYDNNGSFGPWPMPGRTLAPGMKERSITFTPEMTDASGYVLLQMLTIERGVPMVVCSRVLCVTPEAGDPALQISLPETFTADGLQEMNFRVGHKLPCELAVTVLDDGGSVVRRLSARQASRPTGFEGTALVWDGRDNQGELVPAGRYRIRVRAYVGQEKYECISDGVQVLVPETGTD